MTHMFKKEKENKLPLLGKKMCLSIENELLTFARYMATYSKHLVVANAQANGNTFLSFPWIACDVLCTIKADACNNEPLGYPGRY